MALGFAKGLGRDEGFVNGGATVNHLQRVYSGQMMFWVKPEVHRKAVEAAELAGKSLNAWAEEVLGKAAG